MAGMAHRGVNYWLIDIPTRRGVTKGFGSRKTPSLKSSINSSYGEDSI
jgi:hypothetical protein